MEEAKSQGLKPYPIPAGCSEHPYGGLGFVGFVDEVIEQEKELGITFDKIVVCAVTGSTMAGIVAGFARYGRQRDVIGIDGSFTPEKTREQVFRIAESTGKLIDLNHNLTLDDVILDDRFAYPAYGIPNEKTIEAIKLCGQLEGVLTDPVYEGKSMQGLIHLIQHNEIPPGSNVLYCHLGGAPALSAYSALFK